MVSHKKKDAKNTGAADVKTDVKKRLTEKTKEHTDYSTLVGKVRGVLFECGPFFEEMKARASVKWSLMYFVMLVLVYLAVVSAVYVITYKPGYAPEMRALSPLQAITTAVILGFAVSVIFFFVSSVLVHATARLLKGTGTFAQTSTVVGFGSTPAYLLGWIPFLGLLAMAYGVLVQLKGIAIMHGLSQWKAAASVLVTLVSMLVIGILLLVWSKANPFTATANVTTTSV